jgi:PII-like signaling protein
MQIKGDAKLLRIFIGESDKSHSIPVYEKIVMEARKDGLAGATVFKGIMGFGGTSRIRTSKILTLSSDMPLIIEIVDKIDRIEDFLPKLNHIFEEANCGGLVTIEKAEVIKYIARKK